MKAFAGSFLLITLSVVTGVLTGAEFSITGKVSFSTPWDTAGTPYAADLIGVSLNAFVTTIFFIPLIGIYGSCLFLIGLKIIIFPLLCIGEK